MAQNDRVDILFPPGRLVSGSVHEPRTTDSEGRPLTVKNGPNAGQPRSEFRFGVAVPKKGEQHWNQTDWGAKVWNAGAAAFPEGAYQSQQFSWKITDGDSQQPNSKNIRPCDREGYAGNWVVYFSSGPAPKTVNRDGTQPIDPASIERGYYVEVYGNVTGNNQTGPQAGVYINHSIVALNAFGEVIRSGPHAASVGFGGAGVAPGGSETPPAGMTPPAQGQQPATPPPAQDQQPATPPPAQEPASAPPPQTGAVEPDHGFVQNAAGAAPPPPPAQEAATPPPPAAEPKRYNVNGQVFTEDQLRQAGYTDAHFANLTPA